MADFTSSIADIVSAGTKLALVLDQLASEIGSAGEEARIIATEIRGCCAILMALQNTLHRVQTSAYYSHCADLTNDLTGASLEMYAELMDIFEKLSILTKMPDNRTKFRAQVQWAFSKPKIITLRAALDAYRSNLALVLGTLNVAEKATRLTDSVPEFALIEEDEEDYLHLENLQLAHRASLIRVDDVEREVDKASGAFASNDLGTNYLQADGYFDPTRDSGGLTGVYVREIREQIASLRSSRSSIDLIDLESIRDRVSQYSDRLSELLTDDQKRISNRWSKTLPPNRLSLYQDLFTDPKTQGAALVTNLKSEVESKVQGDGDLLGGASLLEEPALKAFYEWMFGLTSEQRALVVEQIQTRFGLPDIAKAPEAIKMEEDGILENKLDKVTEATSAMQMEEYEILQYKMSRMESKYTELQRKYTELQRTQELRNPARGFPSPGISSAQRNKTMSISSPTLAQRDRRSDNSSPPPQFKSPLSKYSSGKPRPSPIKVISTAHHSGVASAGIIQERQISKPDCTSTGRSPGSAPLGFTQLLPSTPSPPLNNIPRNELSSPLGSGSQILTALPIVPLPRTPFPRIPTTPTVSTMFSPLTRSKEEKFPKPSEPRSWSTPQVLSWLRDSGFDAIIVEKFRNKKVDGETLLLLDMLDLEEMHIEPHEKRNEVCAKISGLRESETAGEPTSANKGVTQSNIFKSFRVGIDDPCQTVLPIALAKWNITGDWRQYALYLVYGNEERCLGLHEKPLAVFKRLDKEGKNPVFMLRKHATPREGSLNIIKPKSGPASPPGGFL